MSNEFNQVYELNESSTHLADQAESVTVIALRWAVGVSLMQAIVLPLLPHDFAWLNVSGLADPVSREVNFAQAALLAIMSAWAMFDPLAGSLAAVVFYAALTGLELSNQSDAWNQEWVSEGLVVLLLGRALFSGILHRSYMADHAPRLDQSAVDEEASPERVPVTFEIHDLRPPANEVLKLKVTKHLALDDGRVDHFINGSAREVKNAA